MDKTDKTDLGRVGVEHASELLAVLLVLGPRVALAHAPVHAHLQGLVQVRRRRGDHALAAVIAGQGEEGE